MTPYAFLVSMIAVSLLLLVGGVFGGQSMLSASGPGGLRFEAPAGEARWAASNKVLAVLEARMRAIFNQMTPPMVNVQVIQSAIALRGRARLLLSIPRRWASSILLAGRRLWVRVGSRGTHPRHLGRRAGG